MQRERQQSVTARETGPREAAQMQRRAARDDDLGELLARKQASALRATSARRPTGTYTISVIDSTSTAVLKRCAER